MKRRSDWWLAVCFVAAVVLCFLIGRMGSRPCDEGETREVFTDTVTVVNPEPVFVSQLRTDTVLLPVVGRWNASPQARGQEPCTEAWGMAENLAGAGLQPQEAGSTDGVGKAYVWRDRRVDAPGCLTTGIRDSVQVEIPIMRYEYSDSTYHLWVSGFRVNLEEISVFPTREVVTIKKPPKHWHLGPCAGLGFTRRGVEPFVGVSVMYSIFSF